MKAVVIEQYGGPEVLRLRDMPEPTLLPAQVLVEVHAAGVNRGDLQRREAPATEGPALVYVTVVRFRRGRIIGDVMLGRFDYADMTQQAQTIATLLDERIEQVLGGSAPPPSTP